MNQDHSIYNIPAAQIMTKSVMKKSRKVNLKLKMKLILSAKRLQITTNQMKNAIQKEKFSQY